MWRGEGGGTLRKRIKMLAFASLFFLSAPEAYSGAKATGHRAQQLADKKAPDTVLWAECLRIEITY